MTVERGNEPEVAAEDQDTYGEASAEQSSMDKGQLGVIVLVVLAVLASVVMLVSGSDVALKLALLASLWAAVLGFFLLSRYRWEAAERENELWIREEYYQSELARVASEATDNTRQEPAAPSAPTVPEEWKEIKEQLEQIQAQLAELAGREYAYEPAALYAEARRIAEIEFRAPTPAAEDFAREEEVSFTQPSQGAPSLSAVAGEVGNTSAPRQDNPLAALIKDRQKESERQAQPVPEDLPSTAASETTPEREEEPQPARVEAGSEPASRAMPEPLFSTKSFDSVKWDTGEFLSVDGKPQPEQTGQAAGSTQTAESTGSTRATRQNESAGETLQPEDRDRSEGARRAAPAGSQGKESYDRHGRRRSDNDRDGVKTVAELLAELKKDK
ncbi:DUF6779 domain-containing protein [Corynebacterium phocae]|uniref:DUF6779 domain-containing protein n=1 Tax=Corynebacterium phocae TaxID=161895 RepID=UPI0009513495|nr:DUF6779 domain-containing protein [Corynebacterium phocae]KAA8721606.1 hypothetical protein F4V58_10165 [Corynebacterium phocae]